MKFADVRSKRSTGDRPDPHPAEGLAASIHGLTVSLERDGARSEVLRGVDLNVGRGEIVGLVGESGSGKSVLALSMMGLLPQASRPRTHGSIEIAGVDVLNSAPSELRDLRRHELGVIFQDPMTSLNPTMRVGTQISEVSHDRDTSLQLMTSVGIPDPELRFRVFPHELSGGLRQRVMTAIAVAGRPSLIIADEPTTALDVTVQAQVLELLADLRDTFGCSVVLITHDLAVAAQIADRIAVLYAGRVAELGPVAEMLRRPTHPYTVGLLSSRLSLETPRNLPLTTLKPETATPAERMLGCAYHSRCPLADEQCSREQPPLAPVASGADATLLHERSCWRSVAQVQALAHSRAPVDPVLRSESRQLSEAGESVRLDDVHVRFVLKSGARHREEVHALRGVDLTVGAGESLSIVGESGSGKSTLLRVVAGLIPPTSGAVHVGNKGAQMVFQDAGSSLTPWLTVGELLRERLRPLRLGSAEVQRRLDLALTTIGLPAGIANARPSELSGGQKQRVALARATVIPPSVLLCDEPTSALDASLAASVLNLIRELRSAFAMTVIFVTHDLSVARLMGDQIAVMTQGQIVEMGPATDVIERPEHSYTRSLLASVPTIEVTTS
ncbi:oligopeptide/dipeptide ABC transporter ATP-binding protein [Pedococcus soli]